MSKKDPPAQVWSALPRPRNTYDKPEGFESCFTMQELADFLGMHLRTVRRHVAEGRIPEADFRSPNGWRLWSPQQATEVLQRKTGPRV